jgi:hypothetical protein
MAVHMVETLRYIGLLWLVFNGVIGGALVALFWLQLARERRRVRDSSIAELMAAHWQAKDDAMPSAAKLVLLLDAVGRKIPRW